MNLVITWKWNFATCLLFCGNRSHIALSLLSADSMYQFFNWYLLLHMETISCNSLFRHGPCKCSPNFCVHAVYVCVLYRSMGTGFLRMNIHTLCTLSCTAHTVATSLFTQNVSFLSVKILLHVRNCYIQTKIKEQFKKSKLKRWKC